MSRNALIVGIDTYPIQPLAYCADDAEAVAQVLSMSEYGYSCRLLRNEVATTARIKDDLEKVLLSGSDSSLFYFSGHAAATDYGAFLVSVDCKRADDGIDLEFLVRMIRARSHPEASVIVILDCCHSGAMPIGGSNLSVALRTDDLSRHVILSSDRRVLLAACMDNQVTGENSTLRHGVFTHFLLEALAGDASDENGIVTILAVHDSVAEAFERRSGQRPVFKGDLSGRIVLGTGLVPRAEKQRVDQAAAIERQARDHLRTVQGFLTPMMAQRDQWHEVGHRDACRQITPVIEWFSNRERELPELSKSSSFQRCKQELASKTQALSNIEPGVHLETGKVDRRVGSGTFGTVWRVASTERTSTEQISALKIFHSHDLHVPEKIKRFKQGFSAMRLLNIPVS